MIWYKGLFSLFSLQLLALVNASPVSTRDGSDLKVQTDLFNVQGFVDSNYPAVRKFLGIPYAEPPVGSLRFRAPRSKKPVTGTIHATEFGSCCLQGGSGAQTVYTKYLTGAMIAPNATTSEDCLSLNVYTPKDAHSKSGLPVMIWFHGGGLTSGCSNSPWKDGGQIVQNHPEVIVVTLNYRLNLFGFPNYPGQTGSANLGLLDQRKAVEWIYANIDNFGGDPTRMILFGQSAGSTSVGSYVYSYPDDPLISGYIQESGAVSFGLTGDAVTHQSNFTYLASRFNCSSTDTEDVVKCMQKLPATDLLSFVNHWNSTANGGKSLSFGGVTDNLTAFSNLTDRGINGRFAQVPGLFGNNNNEFSSLVSFPANDSIAPNQTTIDYMNLIGMTCPLAQEGYTRKLGSPDLPLWRYRYFGTFANLNPLPWLGAYHSSELPMVFGTYAWNSSSSSITADEIATSKYIQGAWVAFAKDPVDGLSKYGGDGGWPHWTAGDNKTLVKLGWDSKPGAVLAASSEFDAPCKPLGFNVGL